MEPQSLKVYVAVKTDFAPEIWGLDFEGDGHTLDVHIARLREKLKENDDLEIITIRGLGYKVINK